MLNFDYLTQDIHSITLISSCGCNLKCNYCLINRSSTEEYSAELQRNTTQALKDGSFLQNVKTALKNMSIPYSKIVKLELWGQEPTLTLHCLTEHLEDWTEAFPNLNFMMFSTNGMAYPERILDFLIKLDQSVRKPFRMFLQFSYDGDTSTNEIRGANDQIIFNNLSKLITDLNQVKLNHLNINISLHGVISLELMKKLDTTDKLIHYYNNMGKFADDIAQLAINQRVHINSTPDLSLETPVQASTEDGLLLYNFITKSLSIPSNYFYNYATSIIRKTVFIQFEYVLEFAKQFQAKSVNDLIDKILANKINYKSFIELGQGMPFCGTNNGDLHFMYDGTIITCQNYMFDQKKEYLKADNDFELTVKKTMIDKNFFINPITASPKEVQKFLSIFNEFRHSSYTFLIDHIVNLMFWMSKAEQINRIYANDYKLLFKHALLLVNYNCCLYNNRLKSGSFYTRWDGYIRFMCNGFIDQVEAEMNHLLQFKGEDDDNRLLEQ